MKNTNFTAIDVETATASRMICQIGIVQVEQGNIAREESLLIQPPGNKYDENCIKSIISRLKTRLDRQRSKKSGQN